MRHRRPSRMRLLCPRVQAFNIGHFLQLSENTCGKNSAPAELTIRVSEDIYGRASMECDVQAQSAMLKRDDLIRRRELELNILAYLLKHPDAKDTVDGVIRWWLPQTDRKLDIGEVRDTLEFLLSTGWVISTRLWGRPSSMGCTKITCDALTCSSRKPDEK